MVCAVDSGTAEMTKVGLARDLEIKKSLSRAMCCPHGRLAARGNRLTLSARARSKSVMEAQHATDEARKSHTFDQPNYLLSEHRFQSDEPSPQSHMVGKTAKPFHQFNGCVPRFLQIHQVPLIRIRRKLPNGYTKQQMEWLKAIPHIKVFPNGTFQHLPPSRDEIHQAIRNNPDVPQPPPGWNSRDASKKPLAPQRLRARRRPKRPLHTQRNLSQNDSFRKKAPMRKFDSTFQIVCISILLLSTPSYSQVASPPPLKQNLGLGDTGLSMPPGDTHGAVGRTFIAEHVNNQFQFTDQSTGKVSQSGSALLATNVPGRCWTHARG